MFVAIVFLTGISALAGFLFSSVFRFWLSIFLSNYIWLTGFSLSKLFVSSMLKLMIGFAFFIFSLIYFLLDQKVAKKITTKYASPRPVQSCNCQPKK
jgi:hypothetical protein